MVDKIAGFNVSNANNYKFVPDNPKPGGMLAHYESTHLKSHVVNIFIPSEQFGDSFKNILNLRNKELFQIRNGEVTKIEPYHGTFVLKRTSKELLEKAQEFMKNIPAELKDTIKIEKFKWVRP